MRYNIYREMNMKNLLLTVALALAVTAVHAEQVVKDVNGRIVAIYNDAGQQVYSAQPNVVYTQEPQVVYIPQPPVYVRDPYYSVAPIVFGAAIIGTAAYLGHRGNYGGHHRHHHYR